MVRLVALFALTFPSVSVATVPQQPLATGKPAAIRVAAKAALRCGIAAVRTEPTFRRKGYVSLYANKIQPDFNRAADCMSHWVSANSKRLGLSNT